MRTFHLRFGYDDEFRLHGHETSSYFHHLLLRTFSLFFVSLVGLLDHCLLWANIYRLALWTHLLACLLLCHSMSSPPRGCLVPKMPRWIVRLKGVYGLLRSRTSAVYRLQTTTFRSCICCYVVSHSSIRLASADLPRRLQDRFKRLCLFRKNVYALRRIVISRRVLVLLY